MLGLVSKFNSFIKSLKHFLSGLVLNSRGLLRRPNFSSVKKIKIRLMSQLILKKNILIKTLLYMEYSDIKANKVLVLVLKLLVLQVHVYDHMLQCWSL